MSARAAALHFGISRDARQEDAEFFGSSWIPAPGRDQSARLDGFTEIIDAWLRVLERLRDEHGFTGGYTIQTV